MPTQNFIKTRMGLSEYSALILLSMLWGGSYFFMEIALLQWSPLSVFDGRLWSRKIVTEKA